MLKYCSGAQLWCRLPHRDCFGAIDQFGSVGRCQGVPCTQQFVFALQASFPTSLKFFCKMLRSFTLLLCAGIALLQGCSSSKMTEPLPPERQSTESIGTSTEQELTNSQEDPQVLSAQSTITQSKPEEKQNISEQEKPATTLSQGINQTEQVETASTATIG